MPLYFHSSNRLEKLADLFAASVTGPECSPFDRQIVVVQTSGMGRWLSLRVAERNSICAGMEFLYPNAVIERLFHLVLAGRSGEADDQAVLVWRVMDLLPRLCQDKAVGEIFAPVRGYLADDVQGVKLYQLAVKIADLFDQYQIYRTDMILAWDSGSDWFAGNPAYDDRHKWQPILWQQLHMAASRAQCFQSFMQTTATLDPAVTKNLPARLTLFGVSVIPKFHLDILSVAATHINIDFYILQPCREYWGFIRSRKEIRKVERASGGTARELMLEEVNPLLASQGILGRDFLNMMLGLDDEGYRAEEYFDEEAPDSLLHLVQQDLLDLVNPEEVKSADWDPADRSIQFHSCHSPLREVEVLYDQILFMMQRDRELAPSDILVMVPDLTSYAPFIRVVFENPYSPLLKLPFSIADLPSLGQQVMMDAFVHVLGLLRGRFKASEVLGLLENEAVAARFNLTEDEREIMRQWVNDVSIRWGIDADMLEGEGLPVHDQVSWKAGRERMLLGFAMAAEKGRDVDTVFPYADFDENYSSLLGRFLDYYDTLISFKKKIEEKEALGCGLTGWQEILLDLLAAFFSGEAPFENDYLFLQRQFGSFADEEKQLTSCPSLSFEAVRACLVDRYNASLHARGFMGGGITFCAMLPMRSIPFKVICMLGMNDGIFPRLNRVLEYDLTQAERRLGDRSSKDNDKYLFLETLISARNILYISYTGQSIADNSPVPPSVLVSELLDYLGLRFKLSREQLDNCVVRHRLQSFNKDYFQGDCRFVSFSDENCRAARAAFTRTHAPIFFDGPLLPSEEREEVRLDDLVRFFSHPVKYLYNRVLNIYLDSRAGIIRDHELFVPDGLEQYLLKEELLPKPDDSGRVLEEKVRWLKDCGRLPLGNPGAFYADELKTEMAAFNLWLGGLINEPAPALKIDLALPSGAVLTGTLGDLFTNHQIFFRPAKLGAERKRTGVIGVEGKKDLIQAWILHLALNALAADGPRNTLCVGIDRTGVCLSPVDEAAMLLDALVLIFQQGLKNPVRFFPKFSLALLEGKDISAIRASWKADIYAGRVDLYNSHCFGETEVLDEAFVALALAIGAPLYEHLSLFEGEESVAES
ncbi:MAG: exodeoxyribonuclease V subunit gamma [Pseudomonadota bacterium]